jgi:hypothetical protein
MPENNNFENRLLYHWLVNLVGTNTIFSLNLFLTLAAGLIYSFKIFPSPYILLIFGVVSPILFTICLYFIIRNGSGEVLAEPLPSVFLSRSGNQLLMIFDISLIIGFALLIYTGFLDYFLFRILQTVFFPCMLLIFLRVLFISKMIEKHGDDNERMF